MLCHAIPFHSISHHVISIISCSGQRVSPMSYVEPDLKLSCFPSTRVFVFLSRFCFCFRSSRAESRTNEGPAPSRTGFYFSERYRPATATGPARPPPPQDLLTASLKLTGQLRPCPGRFGGGATTTADRDGLHSQAGGNGVDGGGRDGREGSGAAAGRDAGRWATSNGKRKDSTIDWTSPASSSSSSSSSSSMGSDETRLRRRRRSGTYERERRQRCSVLHYLTAATTTPRPTKAGAAVRSGGGGGGGSGSPIAACATHPEGATAAVLLAAMRERPWEGRPSGGTAQDWAEWLEYLDPTLERHLRWLAVDGLAVQSNRDGGGAEARFVAVLPPPAKQAGEETVEPGGHECAGRRRPTAASAGTGGYAAAAAGAAGPGADTLATGPSMLAGGVRIMKSRPIKMVKPWR